MDSSTFKRFLNSIDNIMENLEDADFTNIGKVVYMLRVFLIRSLFAPDFL